MTELDVNELTRRTPDVQAQLGLLRPVESSKTFESVVDQIVAMIERLGLSRGDRIPNMADLADALEVSKPTVRDALRVLERSGLVRLQRGRLGGGVYVADDTVPMEVISRNVSEADDQTLKLLGARRMFEGLASHLAAAIATEDDLEPIAHTIELSKRYQTDPAVVIRTDGMFHRAIARAAGNELLERDITTVLRQLMPLRDVWGSRARVRRNKSPQSGQAPALTPESFISLHERHLEAIRAREPDRLTAVLHEHLTWLEALFASATGRDVDELFSVPRIHLLGSLSDQSALGKKRRSREEFGA